MITKHENSESTGRQGGFTLIEIMIALAIVSVAVLAVAEAMNQHTRTAVSLEQRLVASWVASDQLALLRHQARLERVREGARNERVELAGRDWRARIVVEKTEVERVFKVTVTVSDADLPDQPDFAKLTTAISDSF